MGWDPADTVGLGDALHIRSIIQHIRKHAAENPDSLLLQKEKPSYQDLQDAYAAKDPLAVRGTEYLAHALSGMIRNINLSFDADRIILLGEYAGFDDSFIGLIQNEVKSLVYYPENYIPDICPDHTPLDVMLVSGSISNMLHEFYKSDALYHDSCPG